MKKTKIKWVSTHEWESLGNFRGLEQGFIVTVLEGEGTKQSVAREVLYIFDKEGNKLGVIDPHPEGTK